MNKHLAELERKMFIEMYGEEEAAKIDALPPIKLPEYSEHKIVTERDKIDRRNNLKQKDMENKINELIKIDGLGKTEATHLIKAGINTPEDLKKGEVNDIYNELRSLKENNSISYLNTKDTIQKWIDAANTNEYLYSLAKKRYKSLIDRTLKKTESSKKEDFINKLSFEMFKEIFGKDLDIRKCMYCNITETEIATLNNNGSIKTSRIVTRGKLLEIDRTIEPKGHYQIGNIGLCCYWCNNAKTDEFTFEEFKEIGKSFEKIWKERLK